MKIKHLTAILSLLAACAFPVFLSAGTNVTVSSSYITSAGIVELTDQYDSTVANFGPAMANAFALANLTGYPMGQATLGGAGHFCAGIALGAGLVNMQYFDDDADVGDEVLPAAGINPVVFAGIGLSDRVDIMGRVMFFNSGVYNPNLSMSGVELRELSIYSFGGKLRYNLVKPRTIMPGIFGFGGISVSGGCDLMYGRIRVGGSYDYDLASIEVDMGSGASQYDLTFESDYESVIKWYLLSANSQVLAYINFYWIFSVYSGFGLSVNYGSFDIDLDAAGNVSNDSLGTVGTVTAVSRNTYRPYYVMPVYILGGEVNLFLLKITVESMVNLRNGSDINFQIGTRIQF